MKVLDIGCGNSAYTLEIARKADYVVGIDIEQERLKCAKKITREQALKNIELNTPVVNLFGFATYMWEENIDRYSFLKTMFIYSL